MTSSVEPPRRLMLDRSIPVLPACELMLADLDGDTAKATELLARDPETLTASLLKLAALLGWAAYSGDLYDQVALLAADRSLAGGSDHG